MRTLKLIDSIGYEVPPDAIPLLTQVKHQLRDLFLKTLNDSGPGTTATKVKSAFLAQLGAAGIAMPGDSREDEVYGHIWSINVEQRHGHPDLLIFSPELSIACGNDSPLYIFQKNGGQWRLLIAVEANGYTQVKDALGGLQYELSPPDKQRHWFLVYAHYFPWCTSFWNAVSYAVLRPGAGPYSPVKVYADERTWYMGTDYPISLNVRADGFRIDFVGSYHICSALLQRFHTLNFKVRDSQVTRISPMAHSPGGFLDEWLEMKWAEAARRSVHADQNMRAWHEKLSHRDLIADIDTVQACVPGKTWQIELTIGDEQQAFATVTRTRSGYVMNSISSARSAGCRGAKRYPATEPPPRSLKALKTVVGQFR